MLTFNDLSKIEAFLESIKDLDYISKTQIIAIEENNKEELSISEEIISLDPTLEEIKAIASDFPVDYQWKTTDIEKYFPKDLKISVQIIQNQLLIMASPNDKHQQISMELSASMHFFVKKKSIRKSPNCSNGYNF